MQKKYQWDLSKNMKFKSSNWQNKINQIRSFSRQQNKSQKHGYLDKTNNYLVPQKFKMGPACNLSVKKSCYLF